MRRRVRDPAGRVRSVDNARVNAGLPQFRQHLVESRDLQRRIRIGWIVGNG